MELDDFSPAPWSHEYGNIYANTGTGDPRVVCRKDFRYSDDDPQWIHDARLIAAAPALFAELKRVQLYAEGGLDEAALDLIAYLEGRDRHG